MRRSILLFISAGLLVLMGALAFWKPGRPRSGVEDFTLFKDGRRSFHLTFSADSQLDLSRLKTAGRGLTFPPIPPVKMEVKGKLEWERIDQRVTLRLREAEVHVHGEAVKPEELFHPTFQFTLDAEGRPATFLMAKDEKASHGAFWLQLLGHLQTTRSSGNAHGWQAEEQNYQGKYLAHYEVSNSQLRKTKLNLAIKNAFEGIGNHSIRFESDPTWTLVRSPGGHLNLSVQESIYGDTSGIRFYRNAVLLSLQEYTQDEKFPMPLWNLAAHAEPYAPGALNVVAAIATEKSQHQSDWDGYPIKKIMADLNSQLSHEEELAFYKKLRGYLFLYPAETVRFRELLLTADPGSLPMRTVPVALGRVGHAEAQAMLRDIITKRQREIPMDSILSLLAQSRTPASETLDFVGSLLDDPSSPIFETAYAAYGDILGNLKNSNPAEAGRRLQDVLSKGGSERDELKLVLIGNSEIPEGLSFVQSQLSSQNEVLVTGAIDALRFMRSREAGELLEAYLESPKTAYRHAAVQAAIWQEYQPALWEKVQSLLEHDQEKTIRLAALDYLKKHGPDIHNSGDFLAQLLASEKDPEIKSSIRRIIEKG